MRIPIGKDRDKSVLSARGTAIRRKEHVELTDGGRVVLHIMPEGDVVEAMAPRLKVKMRDLIVERALDGHQASLAILREAKAIEDSKKVAA